MEKQKAGNTFSAPGSTIVGLGVSALPFGNALANPDPSSPLFWLNIIGGIISILVGAFSPR
jgi:hypothetical protein